MSTSSQAPAASSSSTAPNRPPVTLSPTTHLDPGAYVRGTHPIVFGEHNLIHPRALLTATTHPLNIGTNNIISEKATIGSSPQSTSVPSTNPTASISSPDPNASPSLSSPATPNIPPSDFTQPTTLHSHIHIQPYAQISHSATIHSYTIVEPHAIIHPGITIGAHSKICANVTVKSDVPDWTVVYGSGNQRRSRRPAPLLNPADADTVDVTRKRVEDAEAIRVKGMDREREATSIILRNAARAAVAAKRQSLQR